jgi:hypothetical protein
MKRKTSGVSTKLLWRWARAIHEHRGQNAADSGHCQLPVSAWRRAESLLHKLQLAASRGWTLVEQPLRRNLQSALRELQSELSLCERELDTPNPDVALASVADLFRDIAALHEEFDEVIFEFKAQTLSVVTEPIELDFVNLGPFEIMLNWGQKSGDRPHAYQVIAREPNPACSNSQVTHPHVQNEGLCEGDGVSPIRQALREGRLFDFFLVVANLLRTYNSASPYVALEDWGGIDCGDCGYTVSELDYSACERCGTHLCDDCRLSCQVCSDTYCNDCIKRCAACEETYCSRCISLCSDCDSECCNDCLRNGGRCQKCHEQFLESTPESEEEPHAQTPTEKSTGTDHADAPIQSDRVGQAVISA